ncbi:hypothetical protein [Rhodococcus daqingensis]|uniref:Uncharacterized protein n=1 Tax=Rhodococcus daqingensis TaxID=2479363 RepID=A0ABW2RY24_9NOCA
MPDASAADSVNPQVDADSRAPWTAVATLAVISVLSGVWSITGAILTELPELLVPSAIGLPFGIPALRLFPLGETTTTNWLVDCAAALVMIAVAWMRLVNSARRHPGGGAGRAFWAGLGATVIGVLAGNLIRTVYLSFVLQEGPGAYVASLVGGALVSLIWGTIVGLLVGAAHAIARRISMRGAAPESGNSSRAQDDSTIPESVTARP